MDSPFSIKSEDIVTSADTSSILRISAKTIARLTEDQKHVKWHKMVGHTTFTESRNLANMIPCERLYLKFEGNNPTGTQKDRIALAISEVAKKESYVGITSASCGNFGAALSYAANYFKIPETHIYIPKDYHLPKSRVNMMEQNNAQIHYVDGTYEDAVFYSSLMARENNWFDANPGAPGLLEISLEAYAHIAIEIFRSLRRAPDYVLCPVGNGTTLAGIYFGFKLLYEANKTTSVPRMIATSTRCGNPIIKSFKSKRREIRDLSPDEIKETRANEPLTNWHSFDGQVTLDALNESNGFAEEVSDTKMVESARLLKSEEGLNVHPASASTLAALSNLTKKQRNTKRKLCSSTDRT